VDKDAAEASRSGRKHRANVQNQAKALTPRWRVQARPAPLGKRVAFRQM